MSNLFGHAQMYALRSEDGYLCHRWMASELIGVVLFSDSKTASAWLKSVAKLAKTYKNQDWELSAQVVIIKSYPVALQATINPSDEYTSISRIVSRIVWENW